MRNKHILKSALGGLLGIALVLSLGTHFAAAQTVDTTSTATLPFSPTTEQFLLLNSTDLALGDSGQEIMSLQGLLAELGFLDLSGIGGPTGNYGPLTRDAVARYQAALGVPATGYFGPLTRNAMNQHFARNEWTTTFSGTTGTTDGIGGGEGSDLVQNGIGGGTDLPGIFSFTNPGTTFNGVWYPNAVDMNIVAPLLDDTTNDTTTGTTDTTGTTGTTDDTANDTTDDTTIDDTEDTVDTDTTDTDDSTIDYSDTDEINGP